MTSRTRARALLPAIASVLLGGALAAPASAFNYVADGNGTYWGIQDAAAPRVDTGSIRATQIGPGQSPAASTTINGFGGIKVAVSSTPEPRFNGEMMRGFGLKFDGLDQFDTTSAVKLGGVTISRSVWINRSANWGRWFDSFTNTTREPITVKVAFGGQSGYNSNGNQSALVNTSSGDAAVGADDAWAEVATPLNGTSLVGGPQVTVIGTPNLLASPFAGAMTFAGNWLYDTFAAPMQTTGHEGMFQAYVNTFTLAPGMTKSVLHYVVLGGRVNSSTSASTRAAVEATASSLASAPDVSGLSPAEICSLDNFNLSTVPGFDASTCSSVEGVGQIPIADEPEPVTSSPYDVVEKSLGEMQEDMERGVTTSQQITRAYLDRIAAYDRGPFGFNSYEVVAKDAMAQAKAADDARKAGKTSPVLGIPIAIKNLFDTKDMPTTNGSLTFEGFRPKEDAFQVARLRGAGAVIIGKAALEEYATSGNYSNDPWGQTWNAYQPSKSAIASSGGSATATAASLAGAALGSQTGDSLYGPASAASLVTLRGTDGLESGTGVMPLSWLTDFGGVLARSVTDLADMLDVVAGTDPKDPMTAPADEKIPDEWRSVLDPNALKGKRIGYIPSRWVDPFGTTKTTDAQWAAAKKYLEAAGATLVEMGTTVGDSGDTPTAAPATGTGDTRSEGWMQYIDAHPELAEQGFPIATAVDVNCSQKKIAYVRQDPASSSCASPPADRMTAEQIAARRADRVANQGQLATWMDEAGADDKGVDAVVYPGLLSDVSLNDGGGGRSSFGRRDTPSAQFGSPTVVFPVGLSPDGMPINIQLLGRAWDDPKLVGYAYAFEKLANADGSGRVVPDTAPKLTFKPGAEPQTVEVEKPVESVNEVPGPVTTIQVPAPAPAASGGPATPAKVAIRAVFPSKAKVRRGIAKVTLKNTGTTTVSVRVVLKGKVRRKSRTFAEGYTQIRARSSKTVLLVLGPTGRKALGDGSVKVVAKYTLRNASGSTLSRSRSLTLSAR